MNSEYFRKIQSLWQEVVLDEKKKLDPVDKKELSKDYDDRDDKDIDNDGDTDKSDEYLHNRRKTIKKAMAKEDLDEKTDSTMYKWSDINRALMSAGHSPQQIAKVLSALKVKKEEVQLDEISGKLARKAAAASQAKSFEYGSSAYGPGSDKETDRLDKKADKARAHVQKRQGDKGVKKVDRMTGKLIYGRNEAVDMDTKSVDKALSHDCAKHVASEQWGFGECIPGQHTLVEQEDGNAIVTHYDVMFEHGVEFDVPVEDLEILVSESHKHTAKKMKEGDMKKDKAGHTTGGFRISDKEAQAARDRLAKKRQERGMKEGATYADRTKGASKAETMKDKFKGKAALDMAKDANMDNPELAADDAKGHEDATKAGRAVKGQAPARPGEKRVGDKNIVNPVKGAVTSTTGKEG
jgi:hypothetical protein